MKDKYLILGGVFALIIVAIYYNYTQQKIRLREQEVAAAEAAASQGGGPTGILDIILEVLD